MSVKIRMMKILRNERWIPLRYAKNSVICQKWKSNEHFLKYQLKSTSNPANVAALFCPFLLSPSKIILISTIFLKPFHLVGKVQLFWEARCTINDQKLFFNFSKFIMLTIMRRAQKLAHLTLLSNVKPLRKIAPNLCGFLKKAEL